MRFRRRATEVQAQQWFPGVTVKGVVEMLHGTAGGKSLSAGYGYLDVDEWVIKVMPGDWVVWDEDNGLQCYGPEEFRKRFEPVLEGPSCDT